MPSNIPCQLGNPPQRVQRAYGSVVILDRQPLLLVPPIENNVLRIRKDNCDYRHCDQRHDHTPTDRVIRSVSLLEELTANDALQGKSARISIEDIDVEMKPGLVELTRRIG